MRTLFLSQRFQRATSRIMETAICDNTYEGVRLQRAAATPRSSVPTMRLRSPVAPRSSTGAGLPDRTPCGVPAPLPRGADPSTRAPRSIQRHDQEPGLPLLEPQAHVGSTAGMEARRVVLDERRVQRNQFSAESVGSSRRFEGNQGALMLKGSLEASIRPT